MTSAPLPVILRPSPFRLETRQHVAVEGQSIADILRDFPDLPPEVWEFGVVCIGEWEIAREHWGRVKPRAGSRYQVKVCIRLGRGGSGSEGSKNPLATIAAIALVVVASAITGGAAAGLFGTTLFAAGSTSAALLAAGVSVVGALAINALAPPPSVKSTASTDDDNTASLGSASIQANVIGALKPIPFVMGTHRISPPHVIAPWSENINDDQYVYAICGLNGAHDFDDIRINGTPIDQISGVEYEVRDVINDDSDLTLITKQVWEQQVSAEISGHKVEDDATANLQDTTTPSNSYPQWVSARSRSNPEEIWMTFVWTTLLMQDSSATLAGGVALRLRIRRVGDTAWINLPEFHAQRERLEPFRGMIKLRFAEVPTAFVRLDQDTSRPPWRWAIYARNSDNSESFDTSSYFAPNSGNLANNVTGEDGVAVIYLDPATFPPGIYDVQVMRGYGYKAQDFTASTYRLASNIPYYFTHTAASSPPSLRQEQSKVPAKITFASLSSVWDEYPLGGKGIALLAVKAKNIAVSALTALVTGYANTWDGTDWSDFEPTANPGAWARYLMLGGQSIEAPFVAGQLDDEGLAEWHEFCGRPTDVALFDGSADYFTRGAGLTGATDSKLMTFSCWVYIESGLGGRLIASSDSLGGGGSVTRIVLGGADNRFSLNGHNAAGTDILNLNSSPLGAGRWHHVMGSVDLANTGSRHIYVNGASDLAVVNTFTNDTIDFTKADWGVGALPSGASLLNGRLAELWFAPGVYIDLSIAANRLKFLDAYGRPARLGATGNLPTGSAPLVYLSGEIDEWSVNKGTGGNFVASGAPEGLTDDVSINLPIQECNAYIEGEQSLGEILRLTAGCGSAALRVSDQVGVVIERDRTGEGTINTFTQRNTRGLSIRRAFPSLPDGFRVTFNDGTNDYTPKEIFVYRRQLGGDLENLEAVTYAGITKESQAVARAHLDLKQLMRRSALYSLETDIENIYCVKGSLVMLAHDTVRRHYDAARVAVDGVIDDGTNVTGLELDSTLRLTLSRQYTDFGDDTLASPPAGWASQWDANVTALVTAQASLPSGQGPLLDKTVAVGDSFFAWTDAEAESFADCEVLALIRPNADSGTTDNAIGVILRGSGTNVTKTGYRAVLNSATAGARNRIEISKWVAGSFTFLANATFAWATGTNYWIRFRARGTSLRVRVWADGSPEPGTWNVTTSDADVTGRGKAGAYIYHPSSSFYVGSFAVAPLSGLVIQLKDGSTRTEELVETVDTDEVTFVTPFAIPADILTTDGPVAPLDTDCLVACGPFNSVEKRMLVLGIQPQSEFTASLTLVDEAPPQQWESPSGALWFAAGGVDGWYAPF